MHKRVVSLIIKIISVYLLMGFTYQGMPIDKDDEKKLEKAQKLNQTAQELIDKANILYSEIAENEASKKSEKNKEKALDIQLSALKLQIEANLLEYNVYKKIISELKTQFSSQNSASRGARLIEEKANELFYKGNFLRNEISDFDKSEMENRVARLKEAQEFEKEGIGKQKQVIDIYTGKGSIEETQEISGSNLSSDIEVNEALIQTYRDYISQADSTSIIDTFRKLKYSDSFSASSLRDLWDNHLYVEKQVLAVSDSIREDTIAKEILGDIAMQYDDSGNVSARDYSQSEDFIDEDIIYKIEIAAYKNPLSQNTLKKMYNGNKEIKMVRDEGWSKYSIGDFNSFSEADEYRKRLNANNSFVVAYKNGIKVEQLASKSKNKIRSAPKYKTTSTANLPEGLVFKVQIAADRVGMSEKMLKNVYNGNEAIDMIEEDGWYKYSIGNFITYEQAAKLKETIKVKGVFVVAYKDGRKYFLGSISKSNIVFRVQIAANIIPIASERLHGLYSGYAKINRFEEDEWYKYSIGEYKTFSEANILKNSCGIKGAFIVAFRGNKKINVLEAKNVSGCYDPLIITDWKDIDQIIFTVQFAAFRKELSVSQIKNVYCREPDVYFIKDEGWYKYSIGHFKTYQEAKRMKENSGISNEVFIVAYKNGKKLNIREAVKLSIN